MRLLLACLLTAANVIDWVEGVLRRGVSNDGEDGLRCEDGRLKERPARSLSTLVAVGDDGTAGLSGTRSTTRAPDRARRR